METTEVYQQLTKDLKRINLLRGGARSSKTYSLIQMAVKWLWTGYIGDKHIPTGKALILRETFPALRRTVLAEFKEVMHSSGIMPYVEWRRSFHEFEYKGRMIAFMSLDEESKVLGMQTAWFWINEGNPVKFDIFKQILIRCENFCFLDYNPYDEDGWINQELELKRLPQQKDVALTVSTYRQNPFLPQPIIDEIELLKQTDPEMYEVYNQGRWAKKKGLIYPNFEMIDELPDGHSVIGLDFGFSHPMGMAEVVINGYDLCIKELYYERERLTADVINKVYELGLERKLIIADNARPEGIKEMKNNGLRVKAARKKKDSVRTGINNVKLYHIKVVKGSDNLVKELKNYSWDTDRDEEQKEEPIKKYDDLLDAVRYAANYLHKTNSRPKLF